MRIVFLGTPDFATASLKELVEAGENIVAVVTAPDKPAGRGQKLSSSSVKQYAESVGLKILQPTNLKSEEFLEELKSLQPDLAIVVAFRMLPKAVWDLPTHGTFNLHASLLPQYRGAAPINWAIINGEKETGVTTFFINENIDTGNILFQEKVEIEATETAGSLHDKLMSVGAKLVLKTVNAIKEKNIQPIPQDETKELKPAPKIFKETCKINWQQPVEDVYNLIRGMSPYPAAWSSFKNTTTGNNLSFKLYKVNKEVSSSTPFEIKTDEKSFLKIGCANGWINIKEIQLEGKKRMPIDDFLRGFRISEYQIS